MRLYPSRNSALGVALVAIGIGLGIIVGWIMNFQNLWQYWPETDKFGDVGFQWILSVIGVFVPIVGAVTGWIW